MPGILIYAQINNDLGSRVSRVARGQRALGKCVKVGRREMESLETLMVVWTAVFIECKHDYIKKILRNLWNTHKAICT